MTHVSTRAPTLKQRLLGLLFLALAAMAHIASTYINGQYGYESGGGENYGSAILFVMADIAKFWLLPAIGVGIWSFGMRITLRGLWLLCLVTSIWAATSRYVDQNASELFSSRTKSAALHASRADDESRRAERAELSARISAITTEVDQGTAEQDVRRTETVQSEALRAKNAQEKIANQFLANNGVACNHNSRCRDDSAARDKEYQASADAVALAQKRLGEVRRRGELEAKRDRLDKELAGLKIEVATISKDAKKQDGIVQLAVNWLGVDETRATFHIAVGKAILFIGLLEGLIFLVKPGSELLWPHVEEPTIEVSEQRSEPLTERGAPPCPINKPIAAKTVEEGKSGSGITAAELKAMRKALGKTQPQMAAEVGKSLSMYRKYEQGSHPIPNGLFSGAHTGATLQ